MHPSGDKELWIQLMTQTGVLVGAGAVAVVLCASTLTARIAMKTVATSLRLTSIMSNANDVGRNHTKKCIASSQLTGY